jgi:MFS family permease
MRRASPRPALQQDITTAGPLRVRPWAAVAAATLVGLPLGSIYAFSVFLKPLEALLGASRSELSIVFGLSTICYTVGANIVPSLFGRVAAPVLLLIAAAISAGGMALAAQAGTVAELALGYGALFGIGSGSAFCVVQQCVNLLVQRNRGLVNGYLISLFPLGAMAAAQLCGLGIEAIGVRWTLAAVGLALAATGLAGLLLVQASGVRLADASAGGSTGGRFVLTEKASFWKVFTVFFLAAAAGLTMLSQAAGIVQAYGGSKEVALAATTVITAAIASARIAGGWLVDRLPIPRVAAGAQCLALAGAVLLTLYPTAAVCVVAINMIGVGYGLISGVMAGAISAYWDRGAYGRIASRMYFAWCVAAISLPVVAALLFDITGGYGTAIIIAGLCNLLAIMVGALLPRRS